MSASRSSVRVLKTVSTYNVAPVIGKRKLHMTGPATFPSPAMTRDIESSKRPTAETAAVPIIPMVMEEAPAGVRHFNTSRSLKANNDSSTIDFAYLPDLFGMAAEDAKNDPGNQVRVPILSQQRYPRSTKTSYTKEEEAIMKPQISLASGAETHFQTPSGFAEVHDNNAISFEGLSETMKKKAKEVVEESGMIKQVWNGLLDDIFGSKAKKA